MGKFDARRAAMRILKDLESRTAFAEPLLDGALSRAEADPRDKALCTSLVYGVLRMRSGLDLHVAAASGRPVSKIDPKTLALLRIGAYQLLYMDRVPNHAAVDSAVKAARESGIAHASGFVNAVLRRIAEGVALPVPESEAERIAFLHPVETWLAERWIAEFGPVGANLMAAATCAEPPLFLRLDPRTKTRGEWLDEISRDLEAGPGEFATDSIWVRGGGDPRSIPAVAKGLAFVQGQTSQLIAPMVEPKPGQRILDACAAPGMKTLHLATLMGGKGEIVALDVHAHKVKKLGETAVGHGFRNIKAVLADATEFQDDAGFDSALVDAPCTGLGVLARNPERKWRLDPEDPARLAALQAAILANAARLVKPGGVLVYATCTTSPEENDSVADGFLASHTDWSEAPAPLPKGLSDPKGRLKTWPREWDGSPGGHLDGFFAARFRRRGN